MINHKVITNAARAKDENTQISNTQGTTETVRIMEIPGEVDYKEKMAIRE